MDNGEKGLKAIWKGTRMSKENERKHQLLRVKVSFINGIKIQFKLGGMMPSSPPALVDDLSVGGVGIILGTSVFLYDGQRVAEGLLDLPGTGTVPFEGVIKWQNGRHVGIEFSNMPENHRGLIFRFIAKCVQEIIAS